MACSPDSPARRVLTHPLVQSGGFTRPPPSPTRTFLGWRPGGSRSGRAVGGSGSPSGVPAAGPGGCSAPVPESRGTWTRPRRVGKPDASPPPMWRRREEGPKTCPFTLATAENREGNSLEPFAAAQAASLSLSHPRSPPALQYSGGVAVPLPPGDEHRKEKRLLQTGGEQNPLGAAQEIHVPPPRGVGSLRLRLVSGVLPARHGASWGCLKCCAGVCGGERGGACQHPSIRKGHLHV